MQCDETISHMVTVGRSYFCTLRNTCVTAGKTTMTAGKIYHGCFEMLSWPHCTSANIINICFWLLETCTKCSYFIEENIQPGGWHLKWSTSISYAGHEYTVGRWSAVGQVSRQLALDVLSEILPSGGWAQGQVTSAKWPKAYITIMSLTKNPKPKTSKCFFHCRLEDFSGFEQLFSAIDWGAMRLVRLLKYAWF